MEREELHTIKVFEVLRNSLSGELGVVMKVTGDLLDLRVKSGALVRFKFGKHFSRVARDEAVDFRALVRAATKLLETGKPRRKRTVSAFLNQLAKNR